MEASLRLTCCCPRMLLVDCLPNAIWKAAVHTLDLSWKKMDVKLMMMMMMIDDDD